MPFLERLNGCFVLERALRNAVVVDLDVMALLQIVGGDKLIIPFC